MERGVGSIWCLVLLVTGLLLPGCYSAGETGYLDFFKHTLSNMHAMHGWLWIQLQAGVSCSLVLGLLQDVQQIRNMQNI